MGKLSITHSLKRCVPNSVSPSSQEPGELPENRTFKMKASRSKCPPPPNWVSEKQRRPQNGLFTFAFICRLFLLFATWSENSCFVSKGNFHISPPDMGSRHAWAQRGSLRGENVRSLFMEENNHVAKKQKCVIPCIPFATQYNVY